MVNSLYAPAGDVGGSSAVVVPTNGRAGRRSSSAATRIRDTQEVKRMTSPPPQVPGVAQLCPSKSTGILYYSPAQSPQTGLRAQVSGAGGKLGQPYGGQRHSV